MRSLLLSGAVLAGLGALTASPVSACENASTAAREQAAPIQLAQRPERNEDSALRPERNADSPLRPERNADSPLRPERNEDSALRPERNADSPLRPERNADSPLQGTK
jgi:hypothetical protein